MTVMIMTSQNTSNAIKYKKPYKSWTKDGVNGGPSSIQVLIKWLSQKPNYKRWKRGDYLVDRIPKKELLEEIIDQLRQVGIYHRLTKDVASKISTLQSNYRVVKQWNDTEGNKLRFAGVNNKAVHGELLKRFPHWDLLHPVFSCHAIMDIDSILHQPKTHSILDSYIRKNRAKEAKRVQRSQAMLYTLREHNDFTTQLLLNHEKEEVRFIWPGFQLQKYTNN